MLNILITGATGLVGSDVLKKISSGNQAVFAISRNPPKYISPNTRWIKADISVLRRDFWVKLPSVDVVIHLAASMPEDNYSSIQNVNIKFTEELVHWSIKSHVKKFIFLSTLHFLARPLQTNITENHPVSPETFYGMSKYWCELILKQPQANKHLKPTIFRIPSPIPSNPSLLHNNVIKKWIHSSIQNGFLNVWGKGTRTQNFVSTNEIASAIEIAIKKPSVYGTYNLASSSSISMKKVAQLISRKFSSKLYYSGVDPNESERYNISTTKALHDFGLRPFYPSQKIIETLLKQYP